MAVVEVVVVVLSIGLIAAVEQDLEAPPARADRLSSGGETWKSPAALRWCRLGEALPRGAGRQNVRSPRPRGGFRGFFLLLLFNILK